MSTSIALCLLSALAQDPATPAEEHIRFGDPVELAYDEPFFPGANYDASVTTPDAILGQMHGTRLSRHAEILACFRAWESSPRVVLRSHGVTHEGRELVHAVITTEANHARLDEIRANLARLHDPRGLSDAEGEELVKNTPPVAWMGYSIHGDELSGSDAAVALGYHLVASQDAHVAELLDRVVVVIDPCMNPDGRERIISMVEQSAGYTPNLDYASMHRGHWPYGRGNHYLFDLNRDWMVGTQPETRGRWRAVLEFNPQLFVDAHEMGSLDTFLFYPQERPHNPHFPEKHEFWHNEFAAGAAAAFDERGWSYYTREWADGWAPFYSDAWSSLIGAIGILYEQSSTSGFPLKRASGEVMTYRETVHHQLTASMADLTTLATRRGEVLADYLANKRKNVAANTPGNDRMFVLVPGRNADRERGLLRTLTGQGIECFRASDAFTGANGEGTLGERLDSREFPAGTIVISTRQPMAQLVKAYLTFDERYDDAALQAEREELEQKGETKIYDLSAWSLPHALDVDGWWIDHADVDGSPVAEVPETAGVVVPPQDTTHPPFAWAVDSSTDTSVVFAIRAMELGLQVHASDEPFRVGTTTLPRGSLLIRRHENEGDPQAIQDRVAAAAEASGAVVLTASTGRSPDKTPDLGGGHFTLLARPRVAVLANAPVSVEAYGNLWHHLDANLGIPFTLIDAQRFGSYDLRRYNVLILPPGARASLLRPHAEALSTWVDGGGTLIACAGAAAAAIDLELTSVVLRRDALDELPSYRVAVERERAARNVVVDASAIWEGPTTEKADEEEAEAEDAEVDEDHDEWTRTFSPYGVNLLAEVNLNHWITAGCREGLPVYFNGSRVFLSKPPVETAVRIAPEETMRLGGLVWPEARERIADSAWLTVEASGNGQVILFAAMPAFRGYHEASARLLANAVVLGPGLGASQPLGW